MTTLSDGFGRATEQVVALRADVLRLEAALAENDRTLVGLGRYTEQLRTTNAELLAALKLARQYVAATHASIAGAVGQDNLVSPDLAVVDAAITKAESHS